MSGVLIVPPIAIAAIAVSAGADGGNLLTPDPREVWTAPGSATIDIDLGVATAIDSIYLGYTDLSAAATWTISSATGMGVGLAVISPAAPARAADGEGWQHCFVRLAAPVVTRYLRVAVTSAAAFHAGILAVGLAFEKHRELGGGRGLIDTGGRTDLPSGGFGTGSGVTKASLSFSFVDLTDGETARLWRIARDFGTRRPLVVVEDADLPAAQNDAIHYGVFARFSDYERREANATRWQLSHVEWV
ncbi:hypothetical protein [Sphingomonas sp. CCH15-F11]|uniref:hypothetical protein n=1 Tax=Sphingomonas sp. CCH15-F11 TaxID=1768785 RepID=UPI0008324E13|nr:hypothetical protein [Sphingomonas sp. CCH15-F11]